MRGPVSDFETASFPAVYAALSTERLRDAFSAAPRRIEAALEGLSEDELRARPLSGKWSIHEIALHVTDSECLGAVRIRQALGSGGRNGDDDGRPRFPGYDQDRWARALRYQERSPATRASMLKLFRAHREASGELFAAASPEEWRREGIHSEWGALTLRQLLELYADHGERHLEQILERRRLLGRALSVPPLLPTRLY
jgi:uncharacterized damage-inducible protein DinB